MSNIIFHYRNTVFGHIVRFHRDKPLNKVICFAHRLPSYDHPVTSGNIIVAGHAAGGSVTSETTIMTYHQQTFGGM